MKQELLLRDPSADVIEYIMTGSEHCFNYWHASTSGEAGQLHSIRRQHDRSQWEFVINGGTAPDLAGAVLNLFESSTAGNAIITANAGSNGGEGGAIIFEGHSKGGTASIDRKSTRLNSS